MLDEVDSDIEIPFSEPENEMESNRKSTPGACSQGPQRLAIMGSIPSVFPPLPDFDLSLICEIMSF